MSIRTPWESQFDRAGRPEGPSGTAALGPVLHEPRASGLTYEPFYGLKEKPFSLTSDSRFFYHSRSHAPAFDDLLAGIRRRESLNVLTGDIGTGKTTLCRAVLQNLDRKTFSAFVPDPFASREDLLKVLLMDFGVLSVDDLTSGRLKDASRTELSYVLYEFLGTLAPLQAFAVVIIDEAQNLSLPLLEEIRILSDADGQLQVVLVGQLELGEKLKLPEMRQVEQRVSVHCSLAPLGPDGVAGYVAHRLQTAGGSPDRVRFSPEAVEALYRVSGGVPRVINRLCDRALYQGYIRRVATIDREILESAIPDAPVARVAPVASVASVASVAPAPPVAPVTPVASTAPTASVAPSPATIETVSSLAAFSPEASAPAQAIVPPSVPHPVTPTPDPVDLWLAVVDERVAADLGAVHSPDPSPLTADVPRPERLIPQPIVTPGDREPAAPLRPRFVPRTRVQRTAVERFTRRWLRRLGMVVLGVVGLGVAVVGLPTVWAISSDMVARSTELLEPPALPDLPPEKPLRQPAALAVPPIDVLPLDGPVAGPEDRTGIETSR